MKRKISFSVCLILMLIAAFVSFQLTYTYLTDKYEGTVYGFRKWSDINSRFDDIEAITDDVSDTKWQDIYSVLAEADSYVRSGYVKDIDDDYLLDYVLAGYMYGINDKYSSYMPKSEYDAFVLSSQQGSMVGIGVRISYDNTIGGMYITSVIPGSPSEAAGITAGDVIIGVDGKSVSEIGYYSAYNIIKEGKEGEAVTLSIATAVSGYTETKNYIVNREIVKTETVLTRMLTNDIAYVNILSFDSTTGEEFSQKMDALIADGALRFIFDVRNNPGGSVDGVSEVLDYLLPEGPIIRCISKNGEEFVIESDEKDLIAPMVVIVNENTASGGELFTAALRDYDKATVIGTTTYGKGTMQTVIPLSNGGAIRFSTQMYNPPYGENYEGIGIVPDKTVELSPEASANFYKLTDEEDTQLMSALDEVRNK